MSWIDILAISAAWYVFGMAPTLYFLRCLRTDICRTTSSMDLRLEEHSHTLQDTEERLAEFSRAFMDTMDLKLAEHVSALEGQPAAAGALASGELAGPTTEAGLRALVRRMVDTAIEEQAADDMSPQASDELMEPESLRHD